MSAATFARRYAETGLHIFPCWPKSKRPITTHGWQDATNDADQVAELWGRWPDANIGLACGASGLIVIDFDSGKPGFEGAGLLAELSELYPTTTSHTPTGGAHLYYLQPNDITLTNRRKGLPSGVDVRGNGGYVLMPPSTVTYTGEDAAKRNLEDGFTGHYSWVNTLRPAPLPSLLIDILRPPPPPAIDRTSYRQTVDSFVNARLAAEVMAVRCAATGGRNERLNLAAWRLGKLVAAGRLTESEIRAALLPAALACGLGESEASKTIASGLAAGVRNG